LKIVVLDGYAMNPGDLDWERLRRLGEVDIHDRTPPGETLARSADAEILLTNKTVLGRQEIEALPRLRYIGVLATGYNVVDCEAACDCGVVVANVPAYGTESVAQLVFAHILNHTSAVARHDRSVHAGEWVNCTDFSYHLTALQELHGKVMAVVGLGAIGSAVARIAAAFGMEVIAHTRTARDTPGVRFVGLQTAFREADFLSLHCPLTPKTERLVNRRTLALMKRTAFLVNTGRGPLIDEEALAEALHDGRIAGAGLDVLSKEPPDADNPLLRARNCSITPHLAWATFEARSRLYATTLANLEAFLAGTPQNVVAQPPRGRDRSNGSA
jgi:glycerate dehydrogenase